MKVAHAKFVVSNTKVDQCPKSKIPEYAFIGRSNVGKSSLINMLCNQKKLAKTSSKPGKTQLINHFLINKKWYLVDLPGYGYAKVDKSLKKNWERTLLDFMLRRKMLIASLMITDCRRPLTDIDGIMLDILLEKKIPYHVLLNKSDKLNNSEKISTLEEYKKALKQKDSEFNIHGGCSLFSVPKKVGLEELQFKLMEWLFR